MSAPEASSVAERPSPFRSTSMPAEPAFEPVAPSWESLDRQMVDLFFDRVPFGLAIFDLDGRLERCNRTWSGYHELYFGAGPGYTARGRHFQDLIPGNQSALEELFAAVRAGKVVRQAARRIAIPGVTTYWDVVFAPLFEDGDIVGVLDVVTDATDRVLSTERLEARIRAFTAVSSAMTVDQPLSSTLATIREQIMCTSAATAVSLVIWQARPGCDAHRLTMLADPSFGQGYAEAFQRLYDGSAQSPPGADEIATVNLQRDARSRWLADPRFAALHPFWSRPAPDWDDVATLPLVSGRVFFGELHVHLPAGARFTPDDSDYLRAMADQAALAVENSVLFAEQAEAVETAQRQRLARELHDSVSQALFSMTMHARAAERRLDPLGAEADPARAEVSRLQELTKGALAEMRALIFELRPGALAEEGLGGALSKQAAAIASREQVLIEVVAPGHRLPLSTDAEEHLYRIALEAMNNAVKHAGPRRIDVAICQRDDTGTVELIVSDDGIGFDTTAEHLGHLGLRTMNERAIALGGSTRVASERGAGTRVTVVIPVNADSARG